MVRRGYKACPHCTSEIPVACRTCPNCNAGVRGDTRSTTAAVSPVQCGRLLKFKRVPLGSPDRSRSVRNHAGRSAGVAQRAQQNRDCQNCAEAQNQSSSGHQLEDLGGNSTAVSPVAHGRLTNSDGGILSAYVNQLKIDHNRYLSVAQDEHGVVCYAVAGHVLGPGGSVSISARASQHVLALPMLHTADERHYSHLCSCEDMKPGIQVLTGLDSITSPKATWDKTAGRCLHSKAIEALRSNEDSIIISDLEDNALYRRIDEEVVLDSGEPVFIINPSSGTDFLLSVALEAGHPRSFVGADSAGHLKCLACKSKDCQHCRFVHSWVEEQDGGEWDMAILLRVFE